MRVYDYIKHKLVVAKTMEDQIISGALHPMGLHVVLGYRFYTRVYAILESDLHLFMDLNVKSPNEIKFSTGGGRVAFAMQNRVWIHDAHNYAWIGTLVGHTASVRSISWSNGDRRITTADQAGMIICWDASTMKREGLDSAQKNLIFQTAIFHDGTSLFAAIGSNKHARGKIFEGELSIVCCTPNNEADGLVYVRPGMILPKAQATRKTHTTLLAMARLSPTLFVGTPTGRLLLYTWPLLKASKSYDQMDSHNAEIIHVLLTPDDKFLVTVSSDNTMFIYSVEQMKDGKYVEYKSIRYDLFDAVRFVRATDADDVEREAYTLRRQIEEKAAQNTAELNGLTTAKESEFKSMVKEYEQRMEQVRRQIDAVVEQQQAIEKEIAAQGERTEAAHIHAAEEIEAVYNKRAEEAQRNFVMLQAEKDELVARYESRLHDKIAEGELQKQRFEARRRERQRQLLQEIDCQKRVGGESFKVYDAMLAQAVVDYEVELQNSKVQQERKLKSNDEMVTKAATTASVGDRDAEKFRKDIQNLHEQLKEREERVASLSAASEKKRKENEQIKVEMRAKQEAINNAEKTMQALKHELTILENLRFVLTHQFDELRGEVVPKDMKIRDLEQNLSELETSMTNITVEYNRLQDQVCHVDQHINAINQSTANLCVKEIDNDRKTKVFMGEVETLIAEYKDPVTFIPKFQSVVEEAIATLGATPKPRDEDAERLAAELQEQKRYMQAVTLHHQRAHKESVALVREAKNNCLIDNAKLVREIKALRQERKQLHTHCSLSERQLRDARLELHRLVMAPRLISAPPPAKDHPTPQLLLPPLGSNIPRSASAAPPKCVMEIPTKPPRKTPPQTELERAVHELEDNTQRLQQQRQQIGELRRVVNDLLQTEESRLLNALRLNQTSAMAASTPGVSPGPVGPADTPEWGVPSSAAEQARPMTPVKAPPTDESM